MRCTWRVRDQGKPDRQASCRVSGSTLRWKLSPSASHASDSACLSSVMSFAAVSNLPAQVSTPPASTLPPAEGLVQCSGQCLQTTRTEGPSLSRVLMAPMTKSQWSMKFLRLHKRMKLDCKGLTWTDI